MSHSQHNEDERDDPASSICQTVRDTFSVMSRRNWLLRLSAGAMLSVGTAAAFADGPLIPKWNWSRPGTLNCLPRHSYQYKPRSPTIVVGSLSVQQLDGGIGLAQIQDVLESRDVNRISRKRIRPSRAQMQIDHCRVSDAVVDFDSQGNWYLTFLAEQNFPLEPEKERRLNERIHLKRNEFEVVVRLYSAGNAFSREVTESDVKSREPDPGRLLVAKIDPRGFWVQRERPRYMQFHGHSDQIALHYDRINAAEFQFAYLLDPQSAAGESVRRLTDR